MADDDEGLEDLFSFGASTAPSTAITATGTDDELEDLHAAQVEQLLAMDGPSPASIAHRLSSTPGTRDGRDDGPAGIDDLDGPPLESSHGDTFPRGPLMAKHEGADGTAEDGAPPEGTPRAPVAGALPAEDGGRGKGVAGYVDQGFIGWIEPWEWEDDRDGATEVPTDGARGTTPVPDQRPRRGEFTAVRSIAAAAEERVLNKARLTAYYRTHKPDRMDNIDRILQLFEGRMGVLNEKLKIKYGTGFLPNEALSGNWGIAEVIPREVIPSICAACNPADGPVHGPAPPPFYLVDCRLESVAAEQGRFPAGVALSPSKLRKMQEPEELRLLDGTFAALRSSVHICVMGEGFSSFPELYNHSMSTAEENFDSTRISNCAFFFLKAGFRFVSVLHGGFAAAHAFLARDGSQLGLSPREVLIDYDPAVSLFAQLETARREEERHQNAPACEKPALQKIIDSFVTRLEQEEIRHRRLENDLAGHELVVKMKQAFYNFLPKPNSTPMLFTTNKSDAATKGGDLEPSPKCKLTDPMLPSRSTDLATAAPVGEGGKAYEEGKLRPLEEAGATPNGASDSLSKISSTFTSLTKQMQQPVPTTERRGATSEDGVSTKDSVGSSISFASFANRFKKIADAKISEKVIDVDPGMSPKAAIVFPADSGQPILEKAAARKMNFSGFSNQMNLGSPSADPPTILFNNIVKGEVREENVSRKSRGEKPVGNAAKKSALDRGRFTKFAKSILDTKENPKHAETFTKFSRSLSGNTDTNDPRKVFNRDKPESMSKPALAYVDTNHLLELI